MNIETWRNQVKFKEGHDDYRLAFEEMMSEYVSMQDGYLRRISFDENRIELMYFGRQLTHCAPYRAKPRQRLPYRDEVGKTGKYGIAEPWTTEWAWPVVFAPKKDGSLHFCVSYRQMNATVF